MLPPPSPQCEKCRHFRGLGTDLVPVAEDDGWSCDAFPSGIPDEIAVEWMDHSTPFPGDQGIRFELAGPGETRGRVATRPPTPGPGREKPGGGEPRGVAPVWCVVANVALATRVGPGGAVVRQGTRHFSPGTKVYCFPPLWGDAYDLIRVVGRHRGTDRLVTMVVKSRHLREWRVKLVYSPGVIARLGDTWGDTWNGTDDAKSRAEELVKWLRDGAIRRDSDEAKALEDALR